jgi:hypothetical protein
MQPWRDLICRKGKERSVDRLEGVSGHPPLLLIYRLLE